MALQGDVSLSHFNKNEVFILTSSLQTSLPPQTKGKVKLSDLLSSSSKQTHRGGDRGRQLKLISAQMKNCPHDDLQCSSEQKHNRETMRGTTLPYTVYV